jgi:hypothetical protein
MGCPLHLQIRFDPAHHVLRAVTSCGCAKSCLLPLGATHDNSLGGAKLCPAASMCYAWWLLWRRQVRPGDVRSKVVRQ